MAAFTTKLLIPRDEPLLIKLSHHPGFGIVVIIEAKLFSSLLLEWTGLIGFSNDECWQLLRAIHIGHECICELCLFALDTRFL